MSETMEDKILDFLERNYERLKLEGGHALTEDIKQLARQQVLLYWRKLKDLAEQISDAEVRIALPNQKTPKGRKFSIEGIVDIIREGDVNHMYDIKTHDISYVQFNKEFYEEQLNVYAHVWQGLRKNKLDLAAIISTSTPQPVRDAFRRGDAKLLDEELAKWDPIVPIDVDQNKVEKTIRAFGDVVDKIEDGIFPPPSVEHLKAKATRKEIFATNVCRNCDGRFSCSTYREYAKGVTQSKAIEFMKYFESDINEEEQEDWLEANIEPEVE